MFDKYIWDWLSITCLGSKYLLESLDIKKMLVEHFIFVGERYRQPQPQSPWTNTNTLFRYLTPARINTYGKIYRVMNSQVNGIYLYLSRMRRVRTGPVPYNDSNDLGSDALRFCGTPPFALL